MSHGEEEKRMIVPTKAGPAGESVELSCLFQITEDDFWLMPDTKWRGDQGGARKFSDIKLTCTGAVLSFHPLDNDFEIALKSLRGLMESAKTPGSIIEGIIKTGEGDETKIRLRHQPFHVNNTSVQREILF